MSITRLCAKARQFIRRERGATDPILVIAAIAVSLVLLVGGSFAVAGIIANGKNLNAQSDLDKVATAEAAASGNGGPYLNWAITSATPGVITGDSDAANNNVKLNAESVGFTPTPGEAIKVNANASAWVAGVVSTSGQTYFRDSTSSTIYKTAASIPAGDLTGGLTAPTFP